jgi:1-acyl-sn-glycerol-3-phosphate acyltransferase
MQNVVIDRPYEFIPPHRGRLWPSLFRMCLPWWVRRAYGLTSIHCGGADKIKRSIAAGNGVLIAANHCRPCDPEVIQLMTREIRVLPFMMASWHLFMQRPWQSFVLRRSGCFSVYREGTDRASVDTAIGILAKGSRPLVLFPEGVQTRANDRLNPLLEGVAFVARVAARKRAKANAPGGVVVHPVALRYRFEGDVRQAVEPVLTEIEDRLTWAPQQHLALEARIMKVALALLALKEIQHFGKPGAGTVAARLQRLIDRLLDPLEAEWLVEERKEHVVARVKELRAVVLRDLHAKDLPEAERVRRWSQMADMYLAQSVSFYPPDYLAANPTPEQMLETVERLEEDLTDACRRYAPFEVTVTVGDAIGVDPLRARHVSTDPLLARIAGDLNELLGMKP